MTAWNDYNDADAQNTSAPCMKRESDCPFDINSIWHSDQISFLLAFVT